MKAESGCFPFRKDSKELKPAPKAAAAGYQSPNPVNEWRSLEEALLAFAEEPPHVARSTPKGLFLDTSGSQARRERDCLFQPQVYDAMLQSSLDTVAQLQLSLDSTIDEIRSAPSTVAAPSPVPPHYAPLSVVPPPSDSGHGTSLSGNDSNSPLPKTSLSSSRQGSPTKTVTFQKFQEEPPTPTDDKPNKRRVLRISF